MSKELVPSYEGDLPDGWELATIGELITPEGVFIDGDWIESKDQDPNGDVRLLQLADIGDGFYKNKSSRFLTKEKALELNCTFLKKGDVMLARMPDPLGRACIFPGDGKECVTVVDVCIIRSGTDDIGHKWLMYWVNSPKFRNTIASLQSGTTRRRISRGNLATITFPVPPVKQQKRIVAKIEELFSHIDAGIEALNKAKQLLKQYRQSVLKAAVTGELTKEWREQNKDKLEPASQLLERILQERRRKWEEQQLEQFKAKGKVPKDDKWKEKYKEPLAFDAEFGVPEEWAKTTTDQVYGYVTSGSRGWAKYYSDDGPVFLRMGNLDHYDVSLDLEDIQRVNPPDGVEGSRTRVQAGDSLISITADVGMVGIVPEGFEEAYINQHVSLARPVLPEMGLYLAWLLSGDFSKEQFKALQRGATKVGLGLEDIKAIHFGLPSIEEQGEIVRQIEDKLGAMERLDQELDLKVVKAERNKQSVLASAFSGDLVEHLVSDGSAKELIKCIEDSRLKVVSEKPARKKPQKKSRGKVVKKLIVDVLKEKGEITVSSLMQEAGYKPEEIETFYDDLSGASDSIVELRPKGSKAKSWPYDDEVKLKLK